MCMGTPVKLDASNKLSGMLVNHTGYDLFHVFLAFKQAIPADEAETQPRETEIVYVDRWPKDDSLKLDELLASRNVMNLEDLDKGRQPMGKDPAWGVMGGQIVLADSWSRYWHGKENDVMGDLDYALPMLTLFDQLPPWAGSAHGNRFELYRRGARDLDLSPALSAGGLVICARGIVNDYLTGTPLPVPLTVGDSPVSGDGTTIYEFVLPLDRSAVYGGPSTRPAVGQ